MSQDKLNLPGQKPNKTDEDTFIDDHWEYAHSILHDDGLWPVGTNIKLRQVEFYCRSINQEHNPHQGFFTLGLSIKKEAAQ